MKRTTAICDISLARDLMTPNPVSINETASIREAAACLLARHMSAAPVINEAGRAIGVISLADIVRHSAAVASPAEMGQPVRTIMNDEVFFVRPDTPIDDAIDALVRCKVKRLFVADHNDVLVGVISATDVLRRLNSDSAVQPARPMPRAAVGSLDAPRSPSRRGAPMPTGADIVMAGAI